MLRWLACGAVLVAGVAGAAEAPVGIPHELAVERAARVSEVRYGLEFALVPHAAKTEATERLRFVLKNAGSPLLLDYRDGEVVSLAVNGKAAEAEISNGHVVLPAGRLRVGANEVELKFRSSVAAAEKAITRYEDRDDGAEYLYTLFVPMDAEMAFPCFDQPDLKARFQLTVTAPDAWTVVSNTNSTVVAAANNGLKATTFAETEPISTYLFCFAAGPFVKVHETAGLPGIYVRKSKAKAAESEAPAVQQAAAEGIAYLSKYFAQPFPFPKYDMVLIPGFAYGGMEHAGATFLREESVVFRTAPTATNLFNRDILVLHELTHQWFGDFTTMRWFDDLWLKEGFAQYMAYQAQATRRPQDDVWKRFYQAIKPLAYGIDQTQGTTPIYQDIPNLKDAKSAYGAIVYQKAPGVIKQLHYVVGDEAFQRGLQTYLAGHKYGNAEWSDLVHALEASSKKDLGPWAEMWIRHRGMPQVEVASWSCNGDSMKNVTLTQHAVLGDGAVWPIATKLALVYPDGRVQTSAAPLRAKSVITVFDHTACPAYVFANNDDHAYGLFLLDAKSRAYVTEHIGETKNPFLRTMLWGSLWDSVRAAELSPEAYLRLALKELPNEKDEALTASIIGRSGAALHRYVVSPALQSELTAKFEAMAADRAMHDASKDMRITWFRALPGFAMQPEGRAALKALLAGTMEVPGVQLRQQDRWGLVTALVAYSDEEAGGLLAAELKRDPSGDAQKYAWVAGAARPDAAGKRTYFDEYLHNPQRQEDWIEGSLGAFNYWNQSELTQPYLKPALEALGQIKQTRKIFFLVGWLNAFVDGQHSAEAQAEVRAYLKTAKLDPDLRRKILEAEDELDRTVAIRGKFGEGVAR